MTTVHRTLVVPPLVNKALMHRVELHSCPLSDAQMKAEKVNKQLKCQYLNVSEALAALPLASQQKWDLCSTAKFGRHRLFSGNSSVGLSSFSSSEGALYRQLCHLWYCTHNQFHSMKVCIIQNKCRFLSVLGLLWCFYVSNDMWFNYILRCAQSFSLSRLCRV